MWGSAFRGVANPAAAEEADAQKRPAFADTYRMMTSRISIFVNLAFASLDRMVPGRHLVYVGAISQPTKSAEN